MPPPFPDRRQRGERPDDAPGPVEPGASIEEAIPARHKYGARLSRKDLPPTLTAKIARRAAEVLDVTNDCPSVARTVIAGLDCAE